MDNLEKLIAERESSEKKMILESTVSSNAAKMDQFLTYRQKQSKKDKSAFSKKIESWYFKTPFYKIVITVVLLFFGLSLAAQDVPLLKTIIDSLEPLGLILAIVLYLKEAPERRKQFQYQALSTLDRAKGVKDSKARKIALEDLTDEGINLEDLDLSNANLDDIELYGVELQRGNFMHTNLKNAKMCLANMQKSNFNGAEGVNLSLRCANLTFSTFKRGNFSNANFSNSNMMFSDFSGANFSGAKFIKSKLKGVNFEGAYMSGVDLTGAEIIEEEIEKAFLTNAIMPDGSIHE